MSITRSEIDAFLEKTYEPQYAKIEKVNERIKTVMDNISLMMSSASKLQLDVKFCERNLSSMSLELMKIQRDTVLQMLGMVQTCYDQLRIDETFITAYHQRKGGLLAGLKSAVDTLNAMKADTPSTKEYLTEIQDITSDTYNKVVQAFAKFDMANQNLTAYEEAVTKSIEATTVITKAYDARVPTPAATTPAAAPSIAANKNTHFANTQNNQAPDQQATANRKPKKRSGGCNIM